MSPDIINFIHHHFVRYDQLILFLCHMIGFEVSHFVIGSANLFLYLTHRVMLLQFIFQVIQVTDLVALRTAYIFMPGHVLYLAQIVLS